MNEIGRLVVRILGNRVAGVYFWQNNCSTCERDPCRDYDAWVICGCKDPYGVITWDPEEDGWACSGWIEKILKD